jgi:hypothetical protein
MKNLFTEGEWKIDDVMAGDKRKSVLWYIIEDNKGNHMVEVKGRHCNIKNSTAEANAKLIVAAPNLLRAVESAILAYKELGLSENQSCFKLALEAIKKATK